MYSCAHMHVVGTRKDHVATSPGMCNTRCHGVVAYPLTELVAAFRTARGVGNLVSLSAGTSSVSRAGQGWALEGDQKCQSIHTRCADDPCGGLVARGEAPCSTPAPTALDSALRLSWAGVFSRGCTADVTSDVCIGVREYGCRGAAICATNLLCHTGRSAVPHVQGGCRRLRLGWRQLCILRPTKRNCAR